MASHVLAAAPVASCSSSFSAQASQCGRKAASVSTPASIAQARSQTFGDSKALLSSVTRKSEKGRSAAKVVVAVYETETEEETYIRQWPEERFIEEVKNAFPDKGVASVDEARALFSSLGWAYVDVRPKFEIDEIGKVVGATNIPLKTAKKKYDSAAKKKVVVKEENPNFLKEIEKKFPDKENAKILVACSNGREYSMDALVALDEAGYVNIAGLKGGYQAWFNVFDNKLRRRMRGEYAEDYQHGADSCGIHASGAGFERADKADTWIYPPEWL